MTNQIGNEYTLPKEFDNHPNGTGYTASQMQYPMTKNLKMNIKLLGLEPTIMPLCDHISSQRINMCTNNLTQTLVVDGSEYPEISAGYEPEFLKYRFDPTRFLQDSIILAAVPRYRIGVGARPINYCPSYTVIYLGEEDNEVHCMYVDKYTQGTNGFGYDLILDKNMLMPYTRVKKGQYISHSKNVNGNEYNLGVNANVCYITAKETVEDAVAISEDLAKKLTFTGFRTISVDINKNMVPLNIYGNTDIYKFLPEIGEPIREDGIVCAFRTANDMTYLSDFNDKALTEIHPLHDKVLYLNHPEATLVGLEVFRNDTKKVKTPLYIFDQLDKYINEDIVYYKTILEVYDKECKKNNKVAAKEFNNLVKSCARRLLTSNKGRVFNISRKSPAKYSYKNEAIEFIRINMTLRYKQGVSLGSKLSGRNGDQLLDKITSYLSW